MKTKINTNLIVNIIVIAFILLMAANWVSLYFRPWIISAESSSTTTDTYNSWSNSQIKAFDSYPNPAINYSEYVKFRDSVRYMRNFKNGVAYNMGGATLGFLGTNGGIECDTCTFKWAKNIEHFNGDTYRKYYLMLTGWNIDVRDKYSGDSLRFHVEHGQSYVRKVVVDTSIKNKDGSTYNKLHFADVPVKFRYYDKHNGEGCLLIPVSRSVHNTVQVILVILAIAYILYLFYLIAAFLKLIVDLSKGLAFTVQNIKRLKLIAFSLLIFPVTMVLLNYLIKLIFYNYFTSDVVLDTDVWISSWKPIASGIIFLLLYRAFRQGKTLKEEQDLTI